ncbi:MAG TPA: hypothetical protein VFF67_02255 [Thermoplasmata archaeon]|nr:hypothetical protein [Thermoplasmata archaeon]
MRGSIALWVAATAILVIALAVPTAGLLRAAGASTPRPAAVDPSVTTSPHGNLLVHSAAPQGNAPPGSVLTAEYRIAVVNYTGSLGLVTLRVPGVEAVFETTQGVVYVADVPRNLTLSGGGYYASNLTTSSILLPNATSFAPGGLATFSTELASILGPLPYGQMSVIAQWQWRLTAPDGSTTNGSWSPSPGQSVSIAQTAQLVSIGPLVLARGSALTACLSGPVVGRTFSLHAETVSPLNDFVQNTSAVAAGTPMPACWTITMPFYIVPQPLLIHIWDYNQVTLLLYIVKATLVGSLPVAGQNGTGTPIPLLWVLNSGAIGVGALVGVWAWVDHAGRRARSRPPPPAASAAASDPPGPPPGAVG